MSEYIDKEELERRMYHEAFEIDSDMQKWDSGCWIRYKVFENVIKGIPPADVVEVVHCKDCKYNKWCRQQVYIVNRPKEGKRKNGFEKYANLFPEVDFCSFGERADE